MTESATTARVVAEYLQRRQIDLSTEAVARAEVLSLLIDRFGPIVEREVRLAPGEYVGLMVGSVAVSVRLRGEGVRQVAEQIERYAAFEQIGSFVVAARKALALRSVIGGKPVVPVALWGLT